MSDTLNQLRTLRNDTSALYTRSVSLTSQYIGLQKRSYGLGSSCHDAQFSLGPAMADNFDTSSGPYGDALGGALSSLQSIQAEVETMGTNANTESDGCKFEFNRLTEAIKASLTALPAGPTADTLALAIQSLKQGTTSEAATTFVTGDLFPRCATVLATAAAQAKEISGDTPRNPGDVSAAAFRANDCVQELAFAYNEISGRAIRSGDNQNQATHWAGTARDQLSDALILADEQGI